MDITTSGFILDTPMDIPTGTPIRLHVDDSRSITAAIMSGKELILSAGDFNRPKVFVCPSFIRDVKFSKSPRTGKTTTVVFFEDGTKEIATPADGEEFEAIDGINQCILKRVVGNRSQLKKIYKTWIPGYKAKEKAEHTQSDSGTWIKEEENDSWD